MRMAKQKKFRLSEAVGILRFTIVPSDRWREWFTAVLTPSMVKNTYCIMMMTIYSRCRRKESPWILSEQRRYRRIRCRFWFRSGLVQWFPPQRFMKALVTGLLVLFIQCPCLMPLHRWIRLTASIPVPTMCGCSLRQKIMPVRQRSWRMRPMRWAAVWRSRTWRLQSSRKSPLSLWSQHWAMPSSLWLRWLRLQTSLIRSPRICSCAEKSLPC